MEWSVSVDAVLMREAEEDAVDRLVDDLSSRSAAISVDARRIGADFYLEAVNAQSACSAARRIFVDALKRCEIAAGPVVRLGAKEWRLFEEELSTPAMPELVGVAEVAEMLDVSRQRVSELARTSHFPRPMFRLAATPVWAKPAIERFVKTWNRRAGRRPATIARNGR